MLEEEIKFLNKLMTKIHILSLKLIVMKNQKEIFIKMLFSLRT